MATNHDTVEFTDFFTPDSSVIDDVYYDDNTGDLVVDLNNSLYLYSGVTEGDFNEFRNAGSAGKHYSKVIKPKFGPSTYLGHYDDVEYRRVDRRTSHGVATTTISSAEIVGQAVTATEAFSLTPAGASIPTGEKFKHTVVFEVDGRDRTHTLLAGSVNEAIEAVDNAAKMLDLTFKVKEVCVSFE